MAGIIFVLYVISFVFFIGMINYFRLSHKAGVYPPKRILRKKASLFGLIGILSLMFVILINVIGNY